MRIEDEDFAIVVSVKFPNSTSLYTMCFPNLLHLQLQSPDLSNYSQIHSVKFIKILVCVSIDIWNPVTLILLKSDPSIVSSMMDKKRPSDF